MRTPFAVVLLMAFCSALYGAASDPYRFVERAIDASRVEDLETLAAYVFEGVQDGKVARDVLALHEAWRQANWEVQPVADFGVPAKRMMVLKSESGTLDPVYLVILPDKKEWLIVLSPRDVKDLFGKDLRGQCAAIFDVIEAKQGD